ncbi:MAG: hypothetical protein WCG25_06270 [bacterium]
MTSFYHPHQVTKNCISLTNAYDHVTNKSHIRDHVIHFLALAARLPFAHANTNNNHDITSTHVIKVPTKNVADNMISCINIHGDDLVLLGRDCLIQSVS